MRKLSWIVAVFVGCFAGAAFAEKCSREADTCKLCSKASYWYSRSAELIDDFGCVECLGFCSSGSDDKEYYSFDNFVYKKEKIDEKDMLLIIDTNNDLIVSVADFNPDAAMALYMLGVASKNPEHDVPSKGSIGLNKSFSVDEVKEALFPTRLRNKSDETPRNVDANQFNKIDYALKKYVDGSAFLLLEQRIENHKREILSKTYPDVRIRLQWMDAGYWKPVQWLPVQ